MHTLPSSFLIPTIISIVKMINCELTMYQEKVKINPKRGSERPILKKIYIYIPSQKYAKYFERFQAINRVVESYFLSGSDKDTFI